jgi:DnaK suppressor protein
MPKSRAQHLLNELRSELRKLARSPSQATQLIAERSTDPYDEAQTNADIEMVITSLNADWETAKNIEDAIEKLNTRDYGICESCERPIPTKRLNAIPWVRRCVECQAQFEQQEAQAYVCGKVA